MILFIMVTTDALAYSFGVSYDSTGGLGINYNSATNFANRMKADGWSQKFLWGNGDAWENDWKDATKGGGDKTYADAVDVAFWEGHGSPGCLCLFSPDDTCVSYDDAIWGDWNVEWILAHSCSVLDDSHIADWAFKALAKGGHGMCSHKTTVNACNAGDRMAQLLISGYTFRDAWFTQHLENQYSGCVARVLCTTATGNDKLWNHGGMGPDSGSGSVWGYYQCTK